MLDGRIEYRNGSYYVIYKSGASIKCHNLATAKLYRDKKPRLIDSGVSKP